MKVTENGQKIINYLRSINNDNVVAADISEATGLTISQVNGSTNALCRDDKKLAYRQTVEIVDGDSTKVVKFIKLTDAGMTVDFD